MKIELSSYRIITSCALAGLLLAGCAQQQQRGKYRPAAATTPAPVVEKAPEAPPPQPKGTCADTTGGLIKMNKTMPPEVALGSEFTTELHLVAQGCAANVVVRDTVPANAAYVRSEPSATADGKQLSWQIGNLEAGDSRDIKLVLKAEQEGTIMDCASVSADPRTCAATKVVNPAIQLTKRARLRWSSATRSP